LGCTPDCGHDSHYIAEATMKPPKPHEDSQFSVNADSLSHSHLPAASSPLSGSSSPPTRSPRPLITEFLLGGSATMLACLFTNPIEVVKTRMQVQGELEARAAQFPAQVKPNKVYPTAFAAFGKILRSEGLRGIQSGLGPAMLYQLTMNGTRLGLYGPIKQLFHVQNDRSSSKLNLAKQVLAGSTSGVLAALIGSPFFMIKVRLQIQAKQNINLGAPIAPTVGIQHHYSSALGGLWEIYKGQGVRGLYRGASAAMLRVGIGSGVQLSSYDYCKAFVLRTFNVPDSLSVHVAASLISGLLVTIAMNPPDVISTRMYNQSGNLYKNVFDCAQQTVRNEGFSALYKGFLPHYLRLGPHTILTFVFWEKFKALAAKSGL
jgi:solute carrier family 25 protein 34/35